MEMKFWIGFFVGGVVALVWRAFVESKDPKPKAWVPRNWLAEIEAAQRLANATMATSYIWHREVIKLNKALRRYRRQLARYKDEHGKTRVQVQAKASVEAPQQIAAPEAGKELGVEVRQTSNQGCEAPPKVEG